MGAPPPARLAGCQTRNPINPRVPLQPPHGLQTFARRLDQFRALAPAERRIVIAAMLRLPLFWIGLRLLGLQRLQARLQRTPLGPATTADPAELQRLGYLVNAAANQALGPANCLTRSLSLWWLLPRRGVERELRIGENPQACSGVESWPAPTPPSSLNPCPTSTIY